MYMLILVVPKLFLISLVPAMKVDRGGNVNISDDLTVEGSGTVGGSAITSDLRLKSNIIEAAFGLKEILAFEAQNV